MFQILDLWDKISFGIISTIYRTVMKVYDILIGIAQNTDNYINISFGSVASTVYVLAGVFMLFRVVIGMVQMLINPDLVSDKQAGAGKMLVRIITCIVLLLAFQPNGLLFGENGLFNRLEGALLEEDSIIYQIVSPNSITVPDDLENYEEESSAFKNNIFIDGVYADENWSKTCYYYGGITANSNLSTTSKSKVERAPFKVIFSNKESDGAMLVGGRDKDAPIWIKFERDTESYIDSNGKEKKVEFTVPDIQIKAQLGQGKYSFVSNVSGYKQVKNCENWQIYINSNNNARLNYDKNASKKTDEQYYFGYNNFNPDFLKAMNIDMKKNCEKVKDKSDLCKEVVAEKKYTDGVSEASLSFARIAAGSFEQCVEDIDGACEKAKSKQFSSKAANNEIKDLMDEEALELDFISALIAGLFLIGFLMILTIDIIIREFKLLLMEMLAPIPIISYADPKDKIFKQWFKMYISIYVDLFIKLIALNFAIALIGAMVDTVENQSGLVTFFFIVAILVFAKMIPSMISKIFGLDSMGGSFKDIMGMAKGAAGFGAGAALGAVAGAATGQGLGRLSGFAKGALMGAGSGSKGKIFGGAQGIAAKNAKINQQKADGLSLGERMLVGMAGATGIVPGAKAETQMDRSASAIDAQSNYKKYLLDQVKNKNMNIDASANKVGGLNPAGILRKGAKANKDGNYAMSDYVASANEKDIDMKNEYAKQANLATLTADQWNNMTEDQIRVAFGTKADGSGFTSLAEAQVYQNDRVAALEDFAAGAMANHLKDDRENIKEYNAMVDAVSKAQGAGVAINDVPKLGEFNNKTLSKVKDQAIDGYNKAADDSSLKIKKHIQN